MYKHLTYDEFVDTYKPITNTIRGEDNLAFETYGEEQDFVFAQPDNLVWTEVDGDGGTFIIAGKHFVNRFQYYVCEVPFHSDDQEVVVNLYKECDTCGCFGGWGSTDDGEDCPECSVDTDQFSVYPDTRAELVELLGEEYANEQV
jgi:hypothetical protein